MASGRTEQKEREKQSKTKKYTFSFEICAPYTQRVRVVTAAAAAIRPKITK